jgi:general secretion pathway protein M
MNVRDWLAGLSERERRLVYAAGGLLAVGLLYAILVLPFQAAGHRMAARLDKKTTDLAWMRQVAPQVAATAGMGAASGAGGGESLVVLVDRTAREAGLGNSLRDQSPDGNRGLRLRLETASFDVLVAWLAALQTRYGVSVDAATIDGGAPGIVNASLTLTRPTGS